MRQVVEAVAREHGEAEDEETEPARRDAEKVEGRERGEGGVERVVEAKGKGQADDAEGDERQALRRASDAGQGQRGERQADDAGVGDKFAEQAARVAGQQGAPEEARVERERKGFAQGQAAAAQGLARKLKGREELGGGEEEGENDRCENEK